MGMKVVAHSRTQGQPLESGPFEWVTLDALFAESDVVTLHCPQTPQTQGMVSRARLAAMKPGSMLINTARGGLVDEPALVDALTNGPLAAAAVDVASVEPLPPDSPLLGTEHLLITPHMAWSSLAARKRLMATTAENIRAFLADSPVNVVSR
jgi:glycerate dehydrogenase